jgi:hypothetical protein
VLALAAVFLLARGTTEDGVRTVVRKPVAFRMRAPRAPQA